MSGVFVWNMPYESAKEAEESGVMVGHQSDYKSRQIPLCLAGAGHASPSPLCLMRGSKLSICERNSPTWNFSPWGYYYALAARIGRAAGAMAKQIGGWSGHAKLPPMQKNVIRCIERRFTSAAFSAGVGLDDSGGIPVVVTEYCNGLVAAIGRDKRQALALAELECELAANENQVEIA